MEQLTLPAGALVKLNGVPFLLSAPALAHGLASNLQMALSPPEAVGPIPGSISAHEQQMRLDVLNIMSRAFGQDYRGLIEAAAAVAGFVAGNPVAPSGTGEPIPVTAEGVVLNEKSRQ